MPTLQIPPNLSMHYVIDDYTDPWREPEAVLMLHGNTESGVVWYGWVPHLARRYRVVRPDMRGFGASTPMPRDYPWTIDAMIDDYVTLMQSLGIARVHLIGAKLGGTIARCFAARFPERVYSLSLCDTASEMPPRSLWEDRFATARKEGLAGLVDGTIKRWFTDPFVQRAPQDIEKVRQMILETGVDGYIGCGSAVRDMAQTTMLLKIKTPTLILTGRQDPACTVEQSIVLNRMIEGSKFVIIEEAAHLSNIEQPAVFNQTIREFIDSVDDAL